MCGGDHVRAVTGRQAGNRRAVDDSDSEGVSVVRKDCRRSGVIPGRVSFVKGNPEPVKCRPDSKSPDRGHQVAYAVLYNKSAWIYGQTKLSAL